MKKKINEIIFERVVMIIFRRDTSLLFQEGLEVKERELVKNDKTFKK